MKYRKLKRWRYKWSSYLHMIFFEVSANYRQFAYKHIHTYSDSSKKFFSKLLDQTYIEYNTHIHTYIYTQNYTYTHTYRYTQLYIHALIHTSVHDRKLVTNLRYSKGFLSKLCFVNINPCKKIFALLKTYLTNIS